MTAIRRLQFDFTLPAAEALDALVVALKAKDRAEVVRIALRDLDRKVNGEPGNAIQEARLALAVSLLRKLASESGAPPPYSDVHAATLSEVRAFLDDYPVTDTPAA